MPRKGLIKGKQIGVYLTLDGTAALSRLQALTGGAISQIVSEALVEKLAATFKQDQGDSSALNGRLSVMDGKLDKVLETLGQMLEDGFIDSDLDGFDIDEELGPLAVDEPTRVSRVIQTVESSNQMDRSSRIVERMKEDNLTDSSDETITGKEERLWK